jgi:hypothetical protein
MINGFQNDLLNTTGLIDINSTNVYTDNLYIDGQLFNPNTISGIIKQNLSLTGQNDLIDTNFLGNIIQSDSSRSAYLANLHNTGVFNQNGSIQQVNGQVSVKDLNCGVITQSNNDYITQNVNSTGINTLASTNITNLVVTQSITLPNNISLPDSTYTNSDIVMNNGEIIQTGVGTNQLIKTDFVQDVLFDKNIEMTNLTATSEFNNTTINNSLVMNGGISQNSGFNQFLSSTFPNVTFTGNLNSINPTVFSYLNGTTSNIQQQIDNITTNYLVSCNVGTVTTNTVASNVAASVIISENVASTQNNIIYDYIFNIPQGIEGPQGPKGDTGSRGPAGEDGKDGSDGRDGADAIVDIGSIVGLVVDLVDLAGTTAAITALQAQVSALQVANLAQDASITSLNTKTLYQSTAGVNTRFTSQLSASNGVFDTIRFDPTGSSYIQGDLQVQDLECSNFVSNGDIYCADDATLLGNIVLGTQKPSNSINIGSASNFSTINMNGLNVNINGLVTINGQPYNSFLTPSGLFSQL